MNLSFKLLLATASLFIWQNSFASVDLKIEFDKAGSDGVGLNLTVSNNTQKEACIDGSIIGLHGHLDINVFNVKRIGDEKPVEFYGIQGFHTQQGPEGLTLQPGSAVTVKFNLSSEYDLSKPGEYSLKYHAWNIATCERVRTGIELKSDVLYFVVPPKS